MCRPIQHLKGNPRIPYYSQETREYTAECLVKILKLKPDKRRICQERPIACQENAAFVIDASRIWKFDDYRFDDLGSFRNHGYRAHLVTFQEEKVLQLRKMKNNALDQVNLEVNQCIVKKTYWVHSKTKSFKRKTTEIIQKDGDRGDLVMLEYAFDGSPCPVVVLPHGNAKGPDAKPFIPTAPSTKEIIKSKASHSATGPSRIFDQAFEMQGGLENMKAVVIFREIESR